MRYCWKFVIAFRRQKNNFHIELYSTDRLLPPKSGDNLSFVCVVRGCPIIAEACSSRANERNIENIDKKHVHTNRYSTLRYRHTVKQNRKIFFDFDHCVQARAPSHYILYVRAKRLRIYPRGSSSVQFKSRLLHHLERPMNPSMKTSAWGTIASQGGVVTTNSSRYS